MVNGSGDRCSRKARRRVPLTELRQGEVGVVEDAALDDSDAAFLRAMGLCNEAKVRLCRAGEPCIVAVGSFGSECGCGSVCRIGLARPLAQRIYVTVGA
jgi:Fe2+ transport system protein FeoA